ncbi:cell wall hydrolase [Brevundimonas staleyi]|uniref:Cell wall hydrolase n=1 Tax=Brevundimonas staleyi TaxID=74326 RepID=A0ABW0FVU7_9CAUL
MSFDKYSIEAEARPSLVQRVVASIRAWATSEVGGWTIVAVLSVLALAGVAASFILPRLNAAPPALVAERAPAAQIQALGPDADLADFTLSPEALQDMDYAAARVWNAALPFSTAPIRPMGSLIASPTDIEAYSRALDCLTAAVYYEAASETPQGQAAVAQVVLNRARHPAYPRSVCGVVFQGSERTTGCQFSFTCDGAMARVPSPAAWERARQVAQSALNGTVVAAVGTATHYHTDWVAPYWAPRLSKIVQIGTHIFYRWNGAWGLPTAFTGVYAGVEPVVPKMLPYATLAVETPAEVLAMPDLLDVRLEAPIGPAAPVMAIVAPSGADAAETHVEEAVEASAPVAVARHIERNTPIMADPLVSPTAPQQRQRQRIAAPSGW